MNKTTLVVFSMCPLVAAAALASVHKPIISKSSARKDQGVSKPKAVNSRNVESYGKLPLSFEANEGQTDSKVKFISRGSGYSLFLTSTEAVLSLQGRAKEGRLPSPAVLKMKFLGSNPSPQLTGRDKLPGKSNYFIGNDPAKWRINVPNFAEVKYADVYPGIDLIYYGNQRQLEYDFVVLPGADPRTIRLAIDGDEKRHIDGQGDLVLDAEGREFHMYRPVIYQEIKGSRRSIGGNFVIRSTREVGIEVARYDSSEPLIIDPVLSYSTYLGGSGGDGGTGIAVDSAGNAYVTGTTSSSDFPTANAVQSINAHEPAFVVKLNAAGSALVYSTYLGGSDFEYDSKIAVDSSGNAYVMGSTFSSDFPTANAFQGTFAGGGSDLFVTKLNAAGSALIYSTYLGGSGYDNGSDIAVDSSGEAYVTGGTTSADFPTANAFQAAYLGDKDQAEYGYDAFVTKLTSDGSALIYSTYLAGRGLDSGSGIAVDSSGNAYVTGSTSSTNFPTTPGAFLETAPRGGLFVFVTKLNAAGSALAYSTYLGGSDHAAGGGIAVDSSGNVYVTGNTISGDFPTKNAIQATNGGGYDAFVTKLNAAGSALIYSTYLGGSGDDAGYGIAVDSSGDAYVTGSTASPDFFTTKVFVTKLNPEGSTLVYSTYLGGSRVDSGYGIAVDSFGNAYVTGNTTSPYFPTMNAIQPAYSGGGYYGDDYGFHGDAFVAKFQAVPDLWQEAVAAMKTAAGTDSLNFWQWAYYWQNTPTFAGAPNGFGVGGSISPDLMAQITAVGGGNELLNISAEQWVLYYRQVAIGR